jgi:hypothetical protein
MNWALSLPGACLPDRPERTGAADIDALAALDRLHELKLVADLVQIGLGLNEQPSDE